MLKTYYAVTQYMSEKRGGSGCFRKSRPNPKEPPEGMIKLRLCNTWESVNDVLSFLM